MAAWVNALLGLYTGFLVHSHASPPWPGTPSAYTLQVSMVVVFVRDSAIASCSSATRYSPPAGSRIVGPLANEDMLCYPFDWVDVTGEGLEKV